MEKWKTRWKGFYEWKKTLWWDRTKGWDFILEKKDNFLLDWAQHSDCLGHDPRSENPILILFLLNIILLLTQPQGYIMILFISHILTSGFYWVGVKLNLLIFPRRPCLWPQKGDATSEPSCPWPYGFLHSSNCYHIPKTGIAHPVHWDHARCWGDKERHAKFPSL